MFHCNSHSTSIAFRWFRLTLHEVDVTQSESGENRFYQSTFVMRWSTILNVLFDLSQLSSLSSQGVPLPMPPIGDGLPKWSPHTGMGDCFTRCRRAPQCCIFCCCICFFVPPDINMFRDPAQIYDNIIFFGLFELVLWFRPKLEIKKNLISVPREHF